ncbi:hypothetical protein [Paenarthrobacter sp. NPDC058040]|uniref:hypothetical protein n=1 Tax=unclassified Paenarthrobacter TaxID=2634190 RepID=UPI0036DCDF6E
MPYQAEPGLPIPSLTAAETVPVIPAVDLVGGAVTLFVGGEALSFHHPEPRILADALARSVRTAQWCSTSRTLMVTVAAVGRIAGRERRFSLRSLNEA